jgi:hypothetical protein
MDTKYLFTITILLVVVLLVSFVSLINGSELQNMLAKMSSQKAIKTNVCTTIQDGALYTSEGELLETGYSQWGYNYQGHIFNGMYCDYHPTYRPGGSGYEWCVANYGNDILIMKWNDAWLSNKDCDGDGLLDRHRGYNGYIGSGAWTTNHMRGNYEKDGESCSWTYFVKIIAAPVDAYKDGNMWYLADDTELGEVIWGSFAIIQSIYNDTCTGEHGVEYLSPAGPGFGKF